MLDLKLIRNKPDFVKEKLKTRGVSAEEVDSLLALDEQRRALIVKSETLQAQRNQVSEEISQLKRNKENADQKIAQMQEVAAQIRDMEADLTALTAKVRDAQARLPNIPNDNVPIGLTEEGSVELRKWGELPKFDFEPKAHWEIGEALGILDFERGSKVSGSRFLYYVGQGARLERAIYNFFLEENDKAGFTEVLPPYMVNAESMFGTGQFPKFGEDVYSLENEDETLIPTAEVPLVNYYRDEVIESEKLPVKFTALSPAFRSEAGSAGRDTRGLIRLHQFNKVEMVKFSKPEQSWDELESMTNHAEELLKKLGLAHHVITLTTGDMSFTAAMTHDLEVWFPQQDKYREISSCSNCTDFQARRAHIQYRDENGKLQFVHTLNGSGLAVGRTVAAVLENYQNEDGTVTVPDALQPYFGGQKLIVKEK